MPSISPDMAELLGDWEALRDWCRRMGPPGRDFYRRMSDELAQQSRTTAPVAAGRAANLLALARQERDPVHEAFALRALGNAAFLQGDCAEAVEHYRQARDLFAAAGEKLELARTLSSLVHPCSMLGDMSAARAAYAEARETFQALGETHRLARLEINLASMLFRDDRFGETLEALERAEAGLAGSDDQEAMSAVLVSRGVVLINLARFDEAEAAHRRSRAFALEHRMQSHAAQADYNIAYLYFLRGEYVKAIHGLDRARETARATGDHFHLALCDLDQADVCVHMNLHDDAVRLAHSAWEQFTRLGMPYEAGKALANMAEAEQSLGRDASALELLARASASFRSADNEFWIHMANLYRAIILLKVGRCFEALPLSERAREFFETHQEITKAILAAIVSVRAFSDGGKLEAARAAAGRAAERLGKLPAPWLHVQLQEALGRLAEAEDRPEAALDAYLAAMEQAEGVRRDINFDELRISFMSDKGRLYERTLELMIEREQRLVGPGAALTGAAGERVWRQMERAKARPLTKQLSAGAQPEVSQGSRVVHEINRLREELNWYYRQLLPGPAGTRPVEGLLSAIQEREQHLLRAVRQLPDDGYHLAEVEPVGDLAVVRAHLDRTTLLEYFACGDGFVAAVADGSGIEIVRLPGQRGEIEAALRLLRFQVGKRAMESAHFRRYAGAFQQAAESHLEALYQALIAPLRPLLRQPRLLIVPHGLLHALPFAALQHQGRALIEDFTLLLAPSAGVYALCGRHPDSPHRQALLVAAEPEAAADEVRAVGASLPGAVTLEGADSTLEAVKRQAERSRIIHIAAHGLFRGDSPYFSALQLADGRLNVIDVQSLGLRADMVVLSGCGTALGDLAGGDELIGLTRAFLLGGARTVVASLWDVDDQTTAAFMAEFYRQMVSQPRPAEALRATQLAFRATYPHPFFWAPFQLIGANAPIPR